MTRYTIICRLKGPAFLLLTGVIALLDQAHILSWGRAWPLYLILWGVLALAERATLAVDGPPPPLYPYGPGYAAGYAGQPGAYGGVGQSVPQAGTTAATAPYAPATTGIVPASSNLEVRSDFHRSDSEEEGR